VKFLRSLDLASFFKLTTRERFDGITPAALVVLSLFGVFFIYSAQLATDQQQWVNQLVWLALGAAIYVTTSLLDYRLWLKYAHFVYLFAQSR
jgi:rod shape determining protein RodA